jgi:hypothetical protein
MGKCPPGVLCIENATIIFLIVLICVVLYFTHFRSASHTPQQGAGGGMDGLALTGSGPGVGIFSLPSFSYSTRENDVLMNPYDAPLRDDRIFQGSGMKPPGIPINVPTQGHGFDAEYRQIGILTRIAGPEMILPLMGRPLISNRDKWNFYTMTDKNNMIKLPISHKGRSCTSEYGCDNIYNGDTVYVEGYNDAFKATVYDNNVMRYIPFL